MSADLTVAIIGLNRIGTSMGLALRKHEDILTCVGYDHEPGVARQSAKLGAVSQSYLALHRCVKAAQVIILACPLDEVREYLTIIGEHAPAAAVVIDTSPVKAPVAEWARERLSDVQYFIGWTLALNPNALHDPGLGVDDARADLFENSMIGISDPPGTPESVLNLSSDLASLLGAKPIFLDAIEADGLIAMGHELPRLAAVALLLATVNAPGWREGRKLAGPAYAKATLPVLSVSEREALGQSMILHQENLVRLIDDLLQSLGEIRSKISEGDNEGLQTRIEAAIHQRQLWLEQRRKMVWTGDGRLDNPSVDRPSMFGGWLPSKKSSTMINDEGRN